MMARYLLQLQLQLLLLQASLVVICRSQAGALREDTAQLSIDEEQRVGTVIANLHDILRRPLAAAWGTSARDAHFRLSIPDAHFNVTSNGDVVVHSRIDREDESLCPLQSTSDCVVELSVSASPRASPDDSSAPASASAATPGAGSISPQRIKLRVTIRDVNDNAPQIPQIVYVRVEETDSSRPFTSHVVPLEKATDPDTQLNGQVSYRLESPSSRFELVTRRQNSRCENDAICLLVKDQLDREANASYMLRVVAEDAGAPPLATVFTLNVTVLDVNDNAPQFVGTPYLVSVPESLGENELEPLLIRVNATDLDAPSASEASDSIVYRIRETANKDVRDTFTLDERSGELRLAAGRRLDYERTREYNVPIAAVDCAGCKQPLTAYTTVTVRVTNVNDHSPEITAFDSVDVSENIRPPISIADIRVTDRDAVANHTVRCSLDPSSTDAFTIELRSASTGGAVGAEWRYELIGRVAFDRESQPQYVVTLRCIDDGLPRLFSTKHMVVTIRDRNDNVPRIEPPVIRIQVPEHSDLFTPIYTFNVFDRDDGANALVSLTLLGDASRYFVLNSTTRQLFARYSFDRENAACPAFYNFTVLVRDHGAPPLESNATVSVQILDVNDNVPRFAKPLEVFEIEEHNDNRTLLGRLTATDSDADEQHRRMSFSIAPAAYSDHFDVTDAGDLFAILPFDRESLADDAVQLNVLVTDVGSMNSSSIDVRIRVLDRNDFVPVFVFPNSTHNRVNVSIVVGSGGGVAAGAGSGGAPIASVFAIDRDHQSQVQYSIASCVQGSKCFSLFQIATHSGEVYLTPSASGEQLIGQRFDLRIEAIDTDTRNSHRAYQDLVVVFVEDTSRPKLTVADQATRQFVLIVILAAVLFVLMLFLIVSVVLIKFNLLPTGRAKKTRRQKGDPSQFRFTLNNSLLMPTDKLKACSSISPHQDHIAFDEALRQEERQLALALGGMEEEDVRMSTDDSGKADSVVASCNCETIETEFGHAVCTVHAMSPRFTSLFRSSPTGTLSHKQKSHRSMIHSQSHSATGTSTFARNHGDIQAHNHNHNHNTLRCYSKSPPLPTDDHLRQVEVFNKNRADLSMRRRGVQNQLNAEPSHKFSCEGDTCRCAHFDQDDSSEVPLMYVPEAYDKSSSAGNVQAGVKHVAEPLSGVRRPLTPPAPAGASAADDFRDVESSHSTGRSRNFLAEPMVNETRTFRPAGNASASASASSCLALQENATHKNAANHSLMQSNPAAGFDSGAHSHLNNPNSHNFTALHMQQHANHTLRSVDGSVGVAFGGGGGGSATQADAALKASSSINSFRPHLSQLNAPNSYV